MNVDNMKKTVYLLLVTIVTMMAACEKEETPIPTLEVNYINLDGTWQLVEWRGEPLAEGIWLYIALDRKDHTFAIYDNISTMYPRLTTGTFELENDWRVGDIISGTYDFGNGAWNHDYLVTGLYRESMLWTARDDDADRQKLVRVTEVPADVIEAVRPVEE